MPKQIHYFAAQSVLFIIIAIIIGGAFTTQNLQRIIYLFVVLPFSVAACILLYKDIQLARKLKR